MKVVETNFVHNETAEHLNQKHGERRKLFGCDSEPSPLDDMVEHDQTRYAMHRLVHQHDPYGFLEFIQWYLRTSCKICTITLGQKIVLPLSEM